MKYLFGFFLGWLLAFSQAVALAGSMTLLGAGSSTPPVTNFATVTYITNVIDGTSNCSTCTLVGVSFGTDSATRQIVVAIFADTAASRTISSVTLGGASTTLVDGGTGTTWLGYMYRGDPTGTSGNVVVTLSGVVRIIGIIVWSVENAVTTPEDTDYFEGNGSTTLIAAAAGNAFIGAYGASNQSSVCSPTFDIDGVDETEGANSLDEGSNTLSYVGGSAVILSSGSKTLDGSGCSTGASRPQVAVTFAAD